MSAKVITHEYIKNFFRLNDSERDVKLLNLIMPRLELKEYAHNSFICRIGDEANEMYFIESGVIIVRGKDGEINNELEAGNYFGEYAAITGDKRMANIQAQGVVHVYRLDKKALLYLTRHNSGIYGMFLEKIYDMSAIKYRKLLKLLNTRRGINSGSSRKRTSLPGLFINYYLVFFFFLMTMLFAPPHDAGPMHPVWLCLPIVFMVAYLVITQRALETLILSALYVFILDSKISFIGSFSVNLIGTIGEVVDILLIVLLMGSLTRLFSASGSINALKDVIQRKIKSSKGTLFAAFLSMVLIALDEYLSILINGACFKPLLDENRIPRENSAIVMGMSPGALCILSPLSITGIYLTGVIALSTGQRGLFLAAVPYNFGALLAIVFILLLIIGKLPLSRGLKQAQIRVDEGGELWPEGSDIDEADNSANRGRLANLLIPVIVLVASSIISGTLEAGVFQVNVLYGMCITLVVMFFLYCFQLYMTPEQFYRNVVFCIESMIPPVVLFLVGKCFATGMENIGFSEWLNGLVQNLIQGNVWLLPPIIFGVCAVVGALFDNPWAMYAIGMPIATGLAASTGGNTALYIGAVCAAGFIGNEIAPGDIFFIGPMLGVNPMKYYQAKLPYIIVISTLALCAYTAVGFLT